MKTIIFNSPRRIVRRTVSVLFIAAVLVGIVHEAFAASVADVKENKQQIDRIQREQLLRQQNDIDRSTESHRVQTHIKVPSLPIQKGHGKSCRQIDHIVLQDVVHMSTSQQKKIIKPYEGKCLGVDKIQSLLSDITTFYVNKGYVTTRAYLPAQDLSKGTLSIRIVPGKVGSVKTDKKKTRLYHLGNIFPGTVGEDLNLRDFEQGIDQINRLLSNNAAIDIRPGAKVGESDIIIKNRPTRRWHVNVSPDNYGGENIGRQQLGVTASLDNLTGFNDFISLTKRNTLPFNESMSQSRSTSFLFFVPYGYTTLTTGISTSNYDSTLSAASGNAFHLNGDTQSVFGTLDRVVYRDQKGKATVNATLTNEITNSYIAGQKISVSSRRLTYAALGANYNTRLFGGAFNVGTAYTRGLAIFGALKDAAGLADYVPHAQFSKYTLTAGYSHPFAVARNQMILSTQFSGQYAPKALYGSQQFSVGGMYSVRGFVSEQLVNYDGYYLRNDLTLVKQTQLDGRNIRLRPFVAFDIGSVTSRYTGTQHGTLAGAAVGIDMTSGPVDLNVFTGYPLIYPHGISNEGINLLFRLLVNF